MRHWTVSTTRCEACVAVGMHSVARFLDESVSQAEVLATVDALNRDPAIDGILVQLPVPKQILAKSVIDAIAVDKDIDGFNPINLGLLAQRTPALRPCTPYGVIRMLEHEGIDPRGMDAVVLGQSNIVGRPMALELLMKSATVTICHSQTRDLPGHVARARASYITPVPGGVGPMTIATLMLNTLEAYLRRQSV